MTTKNGENSRLIPLYWEEANQNGLVETLSRNSGELGVLGVCTKFDPIKEEFTYFIGAEINHSDLPEKWEELEIPAASWAVFESIGPMPHAIQSVWERIYSEWLPTSGYTHADAPELEVYSIGDTQDPNYLSWVWIPIVSK